MGEERVKFHPLLFAERVLVFVFEDRTSEEERAERARRAAAGGGKVGRFLVAELTR